MAERRDQVSREMDQCTKLPLASAGGDLHIQNVGLLGEQHAIIAVGLAHLGKPFSDLNQRLLSIDTAGILKTGAKLNVRNRVLGTQ